MCRWGERRKIEIVQRHTVSIDACIADEVARLNALGVHTTNCCCGHGRESAKIMIHPHSVGRARELGLEVKHTPEMKVTTTSPYVEVGAAEESADWPISSSSPGSSPP